MGIINRFLLFVLMIGLALLAVLMLLLCMGAVPEPVWLNELHYILSRRETVAASVVVLVLALHLLGVSLRGRAERTRESGDFILLQNEQGGVRVALPAIRAMAEQTLIGMRGVRMVKVRVQRVRATSKAPETLRLVLDQGYWPDTLLAAPSDDALRRDVELAKALGFNGVRKHQKIEDPRYLYWADRLGLLVWVPMSLLLPVVGYRSLFAAHA